MKALIIEDDIVCANGIARLLDNHGISADICNTAEDGIYMIESWSYDITLVDLCLPGVSGQQFIQEIRSLNKSNKKNMPIIVLSSLEKADDKVEAFLNGADDFICKPIEKKEFIMRVLTAIRRNNGHASNNISIGEITLNLREKSIYIKNKQINFSNKQYNLFQLLIMKQNNILTKREILDSLYGGEKVPGMKIVDVLVCNIRKEIKKYTDNDYLDTVWGMGYRIINPNRRTIGSEEINESINY